MDHIKVFVKVKEPFVVKETKKTKLAEKIQYMKIGVIISCHYSDEVEDYSQELARDIKKLVKKHKTERFKVKLLKGNTDIYS